MPIGLPWTDSLVEASESLLEVAQKFLGAKPVIWGRYFHSSDRSDYNPDDETPFLSANGIKLLPIARQTNNVNGDQPTGDADGQMNAAAIIQLLTLDRLKNQDKGQLFVFLDVEGPPHSLSLEYFTGWATALRRHSLALSENTVELVPCVYATKGDMDTWQALEDAAANGIKCFGAWSAHVISNQACTVGPITFSSANAEPPISLPFEIFAWQYAQDCNPDQALDYSQTNPFVDEENEFLPFLISP